ncbi:autotransporter outer membrane beta-barrel domain-containing protein [Pseudochrobactrum sp. Wa41.01b-1]|uniref:autotransporter family protein n=1 Tax=Pseudochrobactrum sp. Wa41.01b-1 TaxID=2864102 RepID=UPI001C68EE57|nr:autotransporter outer membrane beta-barrel domain-containing protein [Pseudochrobactrum sp. Wa41.01b-1]QYM71680.1 autotransporter outer membrane beta-barrel domain-containing protein [Pseudochrobactrum sp. Wa41.01b-1]
MGVGRRTNRFFKNTVSRRIVILAGGVSALPFLLILSATPGLSQSWTGAQSSDWSNGQNWTGGIAPATNTNASVRIETTTPNMASASGVTFKGQQLYVGTASGTSGTLNLTNSSNFDVDMIYVGHNSSAYSSGTFNIIDSVVNANRTLDIGATGYGKLAISGENARLSIRNSFTNLNIGNNRNGVGHVEILNGAKVDAWNVSLGNLNGSGTLTVDGDGSLLTITGRDLSAAGFTGDTSTTVSNGGQISIIGTGHADRTGMLQLGSNDGTLTSLLLTGEDSRITTTGWGLIGEFGQVEATVEDQAELDVGSDLLMAAAPGSQGVLRITRGGKITVAKETVVGISGAAILTLGEGTLVSSGDIYIAAAGTATGMLNIGAAADEAAAKAGTLDAPALRFGDGAGQLVFNHTATAQTGAYDFQPTLHGNGLIEHHAGLTRLAADNSEFTGVTTVHGGTLQVDGILGGSMTVNGNGRLQGIGEVGSTLNLGTIAPGNSIGTLTVAGDYIGENGLLEIETVLGDDNSSTDLLHVTGSTYGHTHVRVINLQGEGAPTVNGIRIVQIDGDSKGTFELDSRDYFQGDKVVYAGAYGYRLYKNGIETADDGDWYLRSAAAKQPEEPGEGGENPGGNPGEGPGEPEGSIYQRGAPVYETYGNLLQSLNRVGTLQQRVGNRYWSQAHADPDRQARALVENNGVWGIVEGSSSRFRPDHSTTGTRYDADWWKLRAGIDGLLHETQDGRLIGGLGAHYGHAKADISSIYGDGEIDTDGYGLSGTLTWYEQNGFYIDGQAHATWYRSDLSADFALTPTLAEDNDGFGYALSLESGRRFMLDEHWSVTPQAQLAYSHVDFDSFTDPVSATIKMDRNRSLLGRLGVAVENSLSWKDEAGMTRRAMVYGIANLHREFLGDGRVHLDALRLASRNDRTWGGIGLGGTYNWNDDQFSLYGEGTIETSLNDFGDSYNFKGNLGLRVKW